jgi:hypothetical protein
MEEVKQLFGDIEVIAAKDVDNDEFAFLTPILTEQELKIKREAMSGIINVIRVRF